MVIIVIMSDWYNLYIYIYIYRRAVNFEGWKFFLYLIFSIETNFWYIYLNFALLLRTFSKWYIVSVDGRIFCRFLCSYL